MRSHGRYWRFPGASALAIGLLLGVLACGDDAPTGPNGNNGATNQAPTAVIVAPASEEAFDFGQDVLLRGSGTDPEDGALPDSLLVWSSATDGVLGRGTEVTASDLSLGEHLIVLGVTDSEGLTDSAQVDIVIAVATVPLVWVSLLGGDFNMGSPEGELGRSDNEGPVHTVTLSPFEISATEVTTTHYAAWLTSALAGGLVTVAEAEGWVTGSDTGTHPGEIYLQLDSSQIAYATGSFVAEAGQENVPVLRVTWFGADAYCQDNDWRLPTEAEWEYACRAGTETALYNGVISETACDLDANLAAIAWYCGNSAESPHAVMQREANAFGLYDMSGNAAEWCADWYGPTYYKLSPRDDPPGPESGSFKIARGGAWETHARFCRSAKRIWLFPDYLQSSTYGLRPVRDQSPRH